MENHSFSKGWIWHEMDFADPDQLQVLLADYHVPDDWIRHVYKEDQNTLQMNRTAGGKESLWGTITYKQRPDKREAEKMMHFFISREVLVTAHLDFGSLESLDKDRILTNMESVASPLEGFMAILDDVTTSFLSQIDALEVDIRKLMWELEEENGEKVLDRLMNLRHQLLVMKNLIIPISELHMASKEAFSEDCREKFFDRVGRQIHRCEYLISQYTEEVSTMVDLEEVTASVMGNEIMKSLTVITLLFTPISAWGAWWGMNFKYMPELDEKYGYLFAALFILINTALLFFFLKTKGWMGDILNRKKR
ncbi:magnesium transporter CorA family protein [Indiicoccus explosivorum]|uniref:magnesium transporter CorA family protein n=1 Tax=Indiicoccus explosivorum TaxID=1917864 RepID=UPI000B4412C1|nr:magnesium transporter CorA family protein [Indiicoccus explosivorum]